MAEFSSNTYDPILAKDLNEVRNIISDFTSETPEMIKEAIVRLVSQNGKMLRPSFVILAGRYGNFDGKRIYSLAAAVELLHNATLIHDDIIDEAEVRRGKPAMHTMHGSKLSILAGDYLFSSCFVIAAQNTHINHYDKLALAVAKICEGEILQDSGIFTIQTSVRNYKKRIASKTAILFALSLYLGANESGCSDAECSIFTRIGYNIGMAFQIIDDILDFTGNSETTGKPTGHDLKEGIFTLPLILSLKTDNGSLRKLIENYPYNDESLQTIVSIIRDSEGMRETKALANLYTDRALREIEKLRDSYSKDQLCMLTKKLLSRNY